MAATLQRNEYYFEGGQIVVRQNVRRNKYARWNLNGSRANLIVAVEHRGESRKLTYGGAASQSRICIALIREDRCNCDPNTPEIGEQVPESLTRRLAETTREVVGRLNRQFYRLSNEERMTGIISGELSDLLSIQENGWELTVIVQGFSGQTKEDVTGADIGIVIDLKEGGKQVSKAMLFQAKLNTAGTRDIKSLPRLAEQIEKMQNRTNESYVLTYTPTEVGVYQADALDSKLQLEQVLIDATRCTRGDRSILILGEALEKDLTIEAVFERIGNPMPYQETIQF